MPKPSENTKELINKALEFTNKLAQWGEKLKNIRSSKNINPVLFAEIANIFALNNLLCISLSEESTAYTNIFTTDKLRLNAVLEVTKNELELSIKFLENIPAYQYF